MGLNLLCKRECPVTAIHFPSGSCEKLVSKHFYQYFGISAWSLCSDFATFFPLTLAFNGFFSLCLWRAHWAVQCSVGSCGAICAAVFQLWEGRYATESPVISREGRAIITGCVKRVTESEAPVVLTATFSLIYVEMLPGVFLGATGRQQYKCCRMLLVTDCSCF